VSGVRQPNGTPRTIGHAVVAVRLPNAVRVRLPNGGTASAVRADSAVATIPAVGMTPAGRRSLQQFGKRACPVPVQPSGTVCW